MEVCYNYVMSKHKERSVKIFWITLLSLVLGIQTAQAALSFSATPVASGNSLRFSFIKGNETSNEEVRLRTSTSNGKQYQIFQRIVEPFVNERGETLSHDAIKTYTLLGSNASGTLYLQTKETFSLADQLVYTSSSGGASDSLTVVYEVDGSKINESGQFIGRILYTLRELGSSVQKEVFLNAYIEAEKNFNIEIEGANQPAGISISDEARSEQDTVRVRFSGNLNRSIAIYQAIDVFPQDELFNPVSKDLIHFTTTGGHNGELYYQDGAFLSQTRMRIYDGDKNDDAFYITFNLNKALVSEQAAGMYRGRLTYIVDTGDERLEFPFDLEVTISPIFTLEVTLPPEGMRFLSVLPNTPPQIKEVTVNVRSNIAKPYMVIQDVASLMTNEEGKVIEEQYFSMQETMDPDQLGKIPHKNFEPVERGETPIFYSDDKGSSAQFKVDYRLRPYPEIAPGNYATSIVYSLGAM